VVFLEKIDALPEPAKYDPNEDPAFLISTLRSRWLTFDRMMALDENSTIESMLADAESMLDEAAVIDDKLQKISAILRLPLSDKLIRLTGLIRAFKNKIQQTSDNMNQPTKGYAQLQQEFEAATRRTGHANYELPILVESCADFDVTITKFKLDYEHFTEIYQRLLQSDYDEVSSMATTDHIEVSNALMEKYSLLIEAQDDMKQLLKRLQIGKKRSSLLQGTPTVKLGASSFLREIYDSLQKVVACKELTDIFKS